MTIRDVRRIDLSQLVPSLLANKSVIALVPAVADDPWAAQVAWEIARAAASGRRVALVDVSLEQPALDAGAPAGEGLVDAFEFGASLTHVAREQAPGLFFISVGTAPSDPHVVRQHPRWRRLSRGFASEGALLLLYVPADAVDDLAVKLDGVLVLACEGRIPDTVGDIPVLATVREGDVAPAIGVRRVHIPWRPLLLGAGGVLATGAIAALILMLLPAPAPPEPVEPEPIPPAELSARPQPALPTPPPEPTGDTLFYSVQVAAFNRLTQATARADELTAAGHPSTVTPVHLGRRASRWYRVVVGAVASSRAADSVRRALWNARLVDRGQGVILRTPVTHQISLQESEAAAEAAARGLRERGFPAYIVAGSNGASRVVFGAFESPQQAAAGDSLLAAYGLTGTLVSRIGTPR